MRDKDVRDKLQELKDYMDKVGLKAARLAELSDINPHYLWKALRGAYDHKSGGPITLSPKKLHSLQFGLEQLIYTLRNTSIVYDHSREVCKRSGNRYCPQCIEQIKELIRPYFAILPFMQDVTGWNYSKVRNVMDVTTSPSYGNISYDDCDRINAHLAHIAEHLTTFSFP